MRRMLLTVGLGTMLFAGCAVEVSSTNASSASRASTSQELTASQADPAAVEATEIDGRTVPPGPHTFPIGPSVCREQCPGEACCYAGPHVGWLCC